MFTRNRGTHHESGTARRNKPGRSQRPRCVFLQRNLVHQHDAGDGVSTYLALTFGTLLSSQGTDASFVLTSLRAFLRAFPFGLAFPTLSDRFRSDFLGAFQVSAFAFPFPAVPTLSEFLSRISAPLGMAPARSPPGSRSGGAVNVLERGAPMQIEGPRSGSVRAEASDLDDHREDHRAAAVGVGDPLADRAADELLDLVGLDDAVLGRRGPGPPRSSG